MTIENIKITPEELHLAVEGFLRQQGLTLKVKSVDSYGYPVKGWEVEVEPSSPVVVTIQDLTKAIEAGVV